MHTSTLVTPRRWSGTGSRRELLGSALVGIGAVGLAGGLTQLRPSVALAGNGRSLGALAAAMQSGYGWVANHGLSGDAYQAEFDSLTSQGYRLLRLCGYSVAGQPYYASIWDLSPGPAWVGMHGVSGGDYQGEFDR